MQLDHALVQAKERRRSTYIVKVDKKLFKVPERSPRREVVASATGGSEFSLHEYLRLLAEHLREECHCWRLEWHSKNFRVSRAMSANAKKAFDRYLAELREQSGGNLFPDRLQYRAPQLSAHLPHLDEVRKMFVKPRKPQRSTSQNDGWNAWGQQEEPRQPELPQTQSWLRHIMSYLDEEKRNLSCVSKYFRQELTCEAILLPFICIPFKAKKAEAKEFAKVNRSVSNVTAKHARDNLQISHFHCMAYEGTTASLAMRFLSLDDFTGFHQLRRLRLMTQNCDEGLLSDLTNGLKRGAMPKLRSLQVLGTGDMDVKVEEIVSLYNLLLNDQHRLRELHLPHMICVEKDSRRVVSDCFRRKLPPNSSLTKLQHLNLSNNMFGAHGGAMFFKTAITVLHSLETLNMAHCGLGKAVQAFANRCGIARSKPFPGGGLRCCEKLKHLCLRDNLMLPAEFNAIGQTFVRGGWRQLEHLDLSYNKAGQLGGEFLGRAFVLVGQQEDAPALDLVHLNLEHNEFHDHGMCSIFRSFNQFQQLKYLFLAGNKFTYNALVELRTAMNTGALGQIVMLDLHANNLGDLGVHLFTMSWFEYNLHHMRYLDLRMVNLGLGGLNKLATTIQEAAQNETLSTLRVYEPAIPKFKLENAFATPFFLEHCKMKVKTTR
jgi:Ran GTPase-activating protein (RanGAP) involved in mRNA processing and transport